MYDFKRYYFQLNGLGFTTPSLRLTVNNVTAPLNPLANGSINTGLYGFDVNTSGSANVVVTLMSDYSAVLYSAVQSVATF